MSDDDGRGQAHGRLADRIKASGQTIAVAESLTGGLLANAFAAMEGAGEFFRGGVVAYAASVKFDVLGVTPGPVVSRRAADEMAEGVQRLLRSDLAVAVTGVGGPEPQEGHPPGTVFIAVRSGDAVHHREVLRLSGTPEEICRRTCDVCLALVESAL